MVDAGEQDEVLNLTGTKDDGIYKNQAQEKERILISHSTSFCNRELHTVSPSCFSETQVFFPDSMVGSDAK